jgi:hypothetical protein
MVERPSAEGILANKTRVTVGKLPVAVNVLHGLGYYICVYIYERVKSLSSSNDFLRERLTGSVRVLG